VDPREYVIRNQFCACGFAIDREKALALGGYDRRRKMTSDWDLYCRVCVRHGAIRVNRAICAYREPVLRESGTATLATRGILLPSMALQRARNLRNYKRETGTSLACSHRLEQAEVAQRLLQQVGNRMTPRGFRSACLYAALAVPRNRWKALAFRVSPRLFCRLMVLYSALVRRKPADSSPAPSPR
jgi:hypothetical protein